MIKVDKPQNNPIPVNRQVHQENRKYIPKEYVKVAQGMEKQFAEFMINQMKRSVQKADTESSAESYYNSLIDSKRADMMVSQGEGLGISKMILDQIYPKSKRNPMAFKQYEMQTAARENFLKNKIQKIDSSPVIRINQGKEGLNE